MSIPTLRETCPNGHRLEGLGTKCWTCGWRPPLEEKESRMVQDLTRKLREDMERAFLGEGKAVVAARRGGKKDETLWKPIPPEQNAGPEWHAYDPPPFKDSRLEAPVRIAIRGLLESLGWEVYDMEQERPTRQTPGQTDLIAFGFGIIAFLEIKRPSRRGEKEDGLSDSQQGFRAAVLGNGGIHRVLFDETDAIAFHQEYAG